jgi:hypothetical protein
MDGVPGVTQDPVEPGDNFIYRLKLTWPQKGAKNTKAKFQGV